MGWKGWSDKAREDRARRKLRNHDIRVREDAQGYMLTDDDGELLSNRVYGLTLDELEEEAHRLDGTDDLPRGGQPQPQRQPPTAPGRTPPTRRLRHHSTDHANPR